MSTPADASTKGRLLRRAQLVAGVRHPNLARLLPLAGGAGHSPLLDGAQRLADFARIGAPFRRFELEHAIQVLLDVLNALSALHALSFEGAPFVHGAVSPQNICIDADGTARLIPLVNAHVRPDMSVEMNGYVAPEWLLGNSVDQRADLFSVGVLLWEALARQRLFPDGSAAAVMARFASGALPRLEAPPGAVWAQPLCAIAERVVSANPADRHGSAAELSSTIVAIAGARLTRPLGESWHFEAPTLVPSRGSRSRPQRALTPPGVSMDIAPEPAPLVPEPLAAAPLVPEPLAAAPLVPEPLAPLAGTATLPSRDSGALRLFVIGFAATAFLCVVWLLRPQRGPGTPAALAPAATLATLSAALPVPPPARQAPAATATASSVPSVLSPPRVPAPRKAARTKARAEFDYGI